MGMPSSIIKWCILTLAVLFTGSVALLCASLLGASIAGPAGQDEPAGVNSVGVTLPPDAAPPHLQHLRTFELNARYMDRATSSYQKVFGFALTNEPLTRVDRDFNLLPAAATHWEVSEDGLTWAFTFKRTWFSATDGPSRPTTTKIRFGDGPIRGPGSISSGTTGPSRTGGR